jgi:metallophosphoesterase (TIGR00282 family)
MSRKFVIFFGSNYMANETAGQKDKASDSPQTKAEKPAEAAEELKVLFLGEIVGSSGVFCVKTLLNTIKEEKGIDFVAGNADGATGGFGIGKNHSIYLHKLGIDVITTGECVYYKLDMVPHIAKAPYILRAANFPYDNPGRGWLIHTLSDDRKIAVVNVLGQSGYARTHLTNALSFLPKLVKKIRQETPLIIVDFHAVTTAEKQTLFYHLDGEVSAIIGTHTKAMTSDAKVLPNGTAVITDAGRTGSLNSVGGLDPEIEIRKYLTQVPERSRAAWDMLELQGVIITIKSDGKASAIETVRWPCTEKPVDHNRQGRGNQEQSD